MLDARTVNAYAGAAEQFAAQYAVARPAFVSRVVAAAPRRGRLLDIGCGTGRDLAAFLEEGFEVCGVEPVAELRAVAGRDFPALLGRLCSGSLPYDLPKRLGIFDVVHCSAVLMHLEREALFNAIFTVRDLLVSDGIAHLSFCAQRPGLDAENRSEDGRLFNRIHTDQFKAILRRAGFAIVDEQETSDALGRHGIRWVSLIVRRDDGIGERPLLRIERIVNHDSKDATYKLALLRALAELAQSNFHEALWLDGGKVAVPADLVVDCWIRYYWPLFESRTFIPQKNGERPGCAKPVMFRQSLSELVELYRDAGSYTAFITACESGSMNHTVARKKVRDAIRQGPVVFASGHTFSWQTYERRPYIVMAGEFWAQLAELSHWIEPAIRLRWAEETRRFSKDELQTGEVLSLLSTDYEQNRNVSCSRGIFASMNELTCTWTDKPLANRKFDVDHIIPYSLWNNNALWNLVPAAPKVNNAKRDKLIARELLFARRDAVIHTWEVQRERMEQRFDRELGRLMGNEISTTNWKSAAFNRLAEVVEATAYLRQSERWAG